MQRIDFKNPFGMRKYWGSERPQGLCLIFEYLLETGFSGPLNWRDPGYLTFKRQIGDDLFVRVIFHSFGELSRGEFEFDTEIHICSHKVFEVEAALGLWDKNISVENATNDKYASLWAIDLSHLKWNSEPGSNPIWKIKLEASSEGSEVVDWLQDWKKFGESYIDKIHTIDSAVEVLLGIPTYKPSSWVKSDGPASPAAYEYASMLLILGGRRRDDAIEVLSSLEAAITDIAAQSELHRSEVLMLRRVQKLLDWTKSGLI